MQINTFNNSFDFSKKSNTGIGMVYVFYCNFQQLLSYLVIT